MTKRKKQIIAISTILGALIIVASTFCATLIGVANMSNIGTEMNLGSDERQEYFAEKELILASAASVSSDGYPTQTLTATLTPADEDVSVAWSAEWKTNTANTGKDVDEFIVLTPKERTCEVKCIKAFGNDTITVKAEAGVFKKSASCTVSFVGKAQSIEVTSDEYMKDGYYYIEKNDNGVFNFDLANIFNDVSSDLDVSLSVYSDSAQSSSLYFGTAIVKYGYNNFLLSNVELQSSPTFVDRFLSHTIQNGVVTVTVNELVSRDCFSSSETVGSGYQAVATQQDKLFAIPVRVSDENQAETYVQEAAHNKLFLQDFHIRLTVRDNVSGLEKMVKIKAVSRISVYMSMQNISF